MSTIPVEYGHISHTSIYLQELLSRCRLSILLHQSLSEVVKEGTQMMKARKFSAVPNDTRWDCIKGAYQFNAVQWTNFLSDLPSCTSSLSDASLKTAVKGATSVVQERLIEVSRLLETQKKTKATYANLCVKIENILGSSNSTSQSKTLQNSFNSFRVTEMNLQDLTSECNMALSSLKASARGWLEEIRSFEERRLLINRESLELVLGRLDEMMKRRHEVTASTRDTFKHLNEKINEESMKLDELFSTDLSRDAASGASVSMKVDHLLHRSSSAIEWAEAAHGAFLQAHWLLTGILQDERSYIKAIDRVIGQYGFESGFEVSSTTASQESARRSSGVENFFKKVAQGVKDLDPNVARAKGFFERITSLEAMDFKDAWLTLFRLLRRNEDESLPAHVESLLPQLNSVLQKLESLKNNMSEAKEGLQAELDKIHTKGHAIKTKRAASEQALADAKASLTQLQLIKKKDGRVEAGESESEAAGVETGAGGASAEKEDAVAGSDGEGVLCASSSSSSNSNSNSNSGHNKDILMESGQALLNNLNKAALSMGMKGAGDMLEENERLVCSLEAALEKDDVEQAGVTRALEETYDEASVSLEASLADYLTQRRLVMTECGTTLLRALDSVDASNHADEKLVTSLKASFSRQSIEKGVSFFFASCDAQDGDGGAALTEVGSHVGTSTISSPNDRDKEKFMSSIVNQSEVTFEPADGEEIMQLRHQRLLPPLAVKEEASASASGEEADTGLAAGSGEAMEEEKATPKDPSSPEKEDEQEQEQQESVVASLVSWPANGLEEEGETVWRHSGDFGEGLSSRGEANSSVGATTPVASSPAPAPGSVAASAPSSVSESPRTVQRTIDMEKASRMARGGKKEGKSAIFVDMPALFPKDDAMLARELNLPEDQRILAYYNCCIFPQTWQLVQGTMYLSQRYVCFRGWPDTSHKKLIHMNDIAHVQKENTAVVIPNAIRLYLTAGPEILFGSFIDRDPCFDLLTASIAAEKHYSKIMAEETERASSMEAVTEELMLLRSAASVPVPAAACGADENGRGDEGDEEGQRRGVTSPDGTLEPHLRDVASEEDLMLLGVKKKEEKQEGDEEDEGLEEEEKEEAFIPLEPIFHRNREVALLQDDILAVPVSAVWDSCWRDGDGYASFLRGMGDLSVSVGEWESPREHNGLPFKCKEDSSSLHFIARRNCEYLHPRTSMLMFGPKNAPATQVQYLFLQGKGAKKFARGLNSGNGSPRTKRGAKLSGLVLTVTQFDSIPMADVFKVLQYWSFEPAADAPVSHTAVKVGFAIFYVRSSLFRSQISSGTREELLVQSSKWLAFSPGRAKMLLQSSTEDAADGGGKKSTKKKKRPSSLDLRDKEDTPKGPLDELAYSMERTAAGTATAAAATATAAAPTSTTTLLGLAKDDVALALLALLIALVVMQYLDNRAIRADLANYRDLRQEVRTLQELIARNMAAKT